MKEGKISILSQYANPLTVPYQVLQELNDKLKKAGKPLIVIKPAMDAVTAAVAKVYAAQSPIGLELKAESLDYMLIAPVRRVDSLSVFLGPLAFR